MGPINFTTLLISFLIHFIFETRNEVMIKILVKTVPINVKFRLLKELELIYYN